MAESKSSSRIFLLSSLVLGFLAMVAAFVYLENTSGEESGPTVQILVAKHDLREGSVLDPAKDLNELDIPAKLQALRTVGIAPNLKDSVKGQRVNRTILAGTPVLLADLAPTPTITLTPGTMAMAIAVKGAHGLSGLVGPGDYVKLMVTRPAPVAMPSRASTNPIEIPEPSGNKFETVPVGTTAYKVLAVGGQTTRSRSMTAADMYASAGQSSSQQNITLEVTEAQARLILQETGGGQLTVTLLLAPAPAGR